MLLWALKAQLFAAAAVAGVAAEKPTLVVVLTGMSLVFAILFILIAVFLIEAKIFAAVEKKALVKPQTAQTPADKAAAPAAAAPPAVSAAPVVEAGISPAVVAAITAAIHAATGGAYALRAVSTSKKGRSAWGLAGVMQSTEPF